MGNQRITLALINQSGGFESTPDRVCLGDLADFSTDVSTFLRGDGKEIDPRTLEVAIRAGSFAIETTPLFDAPRLFQDLRTLLCSEKLDSLDTKRRDIMERWQKLTRQTQHIAYRISAPFLERSIEVNSASDYHTDDADQWVQVERYIRGEVQDLGGITKANPHIKLPDGKTLKVTVDREALRRDTVNRLYKTAMLRVKSEYNVFTREWRNARLLEFVEYANTVDEEALARLTRRGAVAWRDVPNATAWVDDLRGGGRL